MNDSNKMTGQFGQSFLVQCSNYSVICRERYGDFLKINVDRW
jgi:hypothetical protein